MVIFPSGCHALPPRWSSFIAFWPGCAWGRDISSQRQAAASSLWHVKPDVPPWSSWPNCWTHCPLSGDSCDEPFPRGWGVFHSGPAITGDERGPYWDQGMATWGKNNHQDACGVEPQPTKVPYFHLPSSPVSHIQDTNQTPTHPLAHSIPPAPTSTHQPICAPVSQLVMTINPSSAIAAHRQGVVLTKKLEIQKAAWYPNHHGPKFAMVSVGTLGVCRFYLGGRVS